MPNKSIAQFKDQAIETLDLIANGLSVASACSQVKLPIRVFYEYIKLSEMFRERYHEARTIGHDALADALLNIRDHPIYGSKDPREQKNISNNIKWLLARRERARYGDNAQAAPDSNADKAIADAFVNAKKRLKQLDAEHSPHSNIVPIGDNQIKNK